MTVNTKVLLLLGALASLNLALWGARHFLDGSLHPLLRALGA